jgi:hypothetical protein
MPRASNFSLFFWNPNYPDAFVANIRHLGTVYVGRRRGLDNRAMLSNPLTMARRALGENAQFKTWRSDGDSVHQIYLILPIMALLQITLITATLVASFAISAGVRDALKILYNCEVLVLGL